MTFTAQSSFKKNKKYISKIFRFSAEHVFLSSLVLILVSLLLSALVFYKYGILSQRVEPELGPVIKFEKDTYQKIMKEWQDRGERFDTAKTKEYPDLFE